MANDAETLRDVETLRLQYENGEQLTRALYELLIGAAVKDYARRTGRLARGVPLAVAAGCWDAATLMSQDRSFRGRKLDVQIYGGELPEQYREAHEGRKAFVSVTLEERNGPFLDPAAFGTPKLVFPVDVPRSMKALEDSTLRLLGFISYVSSIDSSEQTESDWRRCLRDSGAKKNAEARNPIVEAMKRGDYRGRTQTDVARELAKGIDTAIRGKLRTVPRHMIRAAKDLYIEGKTFAEIAQTLPGPPSIETIEGWHSRDWKLK